MNTALIHNPAGGNYKVDLRATGRYFGIDIRSTNADVDWRIDSIEVDMEISSYGR